jgi:hypothetical protein
MKLVGSNPGSVVSATEKREGVANYLIGNDRAKWHTAIPTFGKVSYSEIYPHTNLVYYGTQNRLEYDLVLNSGADTETILFSFDGAERLSTDETGDLRIATSVGDMTLRKPLIYQVEGSGRKQIEGSYVLRAGNTVGVGVQNYDRTRPLVIDPVLEYSSYLGGPENDGPEGVAVDASGCAYVVGWTQSDGFPTEGTSISSPPANDTFVGFVAKLNATGTDLVYSTYLGGTVYDAATSVRVDANGRAYVAGTTSSDDFPVTAGAYQEALAMGAYSNAFLAKLSSDGQSLLYSTYLGGEGEDYGSGLAIDGTGGAYIAGTASSADFPTTAGAFQTSLGMASGKAFVSRIDTTASGSPSLTYSTLLGGTLYDYGGAIALSANGNIYVGGTACSEDFPVTEETAYQTAVNPACSGFVAQLDPTQTGSASLVYSTYLGSTAMNSYGSWIVGLALDASSKVYVSGYTTDPDFPTTVGSNPASSGADWKAFLSKLDTTQSGSASLIYSRLIGGSGQDWPWSTMAVDMNGNAYVGGYTNSTDFPVTADALQSELGAEENNGFLAVLNADASEYIYATYLDGEGSVGAIGVWAIALDAGNNIYAVGSTTSTDISTTMGALQTTLSGSWDGFITKITTVLPSITSLSAVSGYTADTLTIYGVNFGESEGSVTFNSTSASVSSWDPAEITVTVPGVSPGLVSIRVNTELAGPSLPEPFVILAPPSISSLAPNSGAIDRPMIILGSDFGSTQGTSTVTIGGESAAPLNWSSTQILTRVPSGLSAGNANVIVTVHGFTSNAATFTVVSNTLESITVTRSDGAIDWAALGEPYTSVASGTAVAVPGIPHLTATLVTANAQPMMALTNCAYPGDCGWYGNFAENAPILWVGGTYHESEWIANGPLSLSLSSPQAGLEFQVMSDELGPFPATVCGYNAANELLGCAPFDGYATGNGDNSAIRIGFHASAPVISKIVIDAAGTYYPHDFAIGNIAVTSGLGLLMTGGSQQFVATGTYTDGRTENLTDSATWTSSAESVATLNGTGVATAVAAGQTTIQASASSVDGSTVLTVVALASSVDISDPRQGHTATLLTDGTVLIVGGYDDSGAVMESAEIYDPSNEMVAATGSMVDARGGHTATLLDNGKVLVAGGYDENGAPLDSVELFDPSTGMFTSAGSMANARGGHSATLLNDGSVLIAGGYDIDSNALDRAELFFPATGTFASVGRMRSARGFHAATLLNDGSVLLAGGFGSSGNVLASAEIFYPTSRIFVSTGNLAAKRALHTATLLNGGKVLLAGGMDDAALMDTAELFDPSQGTFSSTGKMVTARSAHTATLLNNGTVLIVGGYGETFSPLSTLEVFSVLPGAFMTPGNRSSESVFQTTTLLADGSVLFTGGLDGDFAAVTTTELYEPGSLTPPGLVSITLTPSSPSVSAGVAQVFVATGTFGDSSTQVLSSATWNSSDEAKASITGDATNRGHAFGLAAGSTTISACTGAVCGTTGLSVTSSGLHITNLFPSSGPIGSTVIIAGTGFGSMMDAVTFDGEMADIQLWSDTGIIATVPETMTGDVVVTVDSVDSNAVTFTVTPAPIISSLTPNSGSPGMLVTIEGTNFGDNPGQDIIFNSASAAVSEWNDTSIVVHVPDGATTGDVSVVTAYGLASNGEGFTVPNLITGVTPHSGPVGAPVRIVGTGFGSSQGSNSVIFDATAATIESWSPTEIVANVPSLSTGSVDLVVTISSVESNTISFTVLPSPSISELEPTSGPPTSEVTISGSNFGENQGRSTISFDGVPATVTDWGPNTIVAKVPLGGMLGEVDVVVTLSGVDSNSETFTVTAPELDHITVTPATPYVLEGWTAQFKAVGTYEDGTTQDLTDEVTWSSADTEVATVDSNGLATAITIGETTIEATLDLISDTADLSVSSVAPTGALTSPRTAHTATLLTDGTVLVTGGSSSDPASAEVFDPVTRTSIAVGRMSTSRSCQTATLLDNGSVLIVGGFDKYGTTLGTAEIFTPANGSFSPTGSLISQRGCHGATLLNDGTVLITGGFDGTFNALASAEIYNPATRFFTSVGNMVVGRTRHTTTLLTDGTVLVAAGYDANNEALADSEVYDPTTRDFSATGTMDVARGGHTATSLNDGKVLIAGGFDGDGYATDTAELYDPMGGTFSSTGSLATARGQHAATLLSSGLVLLTGGKNDGGSVFSISELYDPVSGMFSSGDSMHRGRFDHTSTLLMDGTVLAIGGTNNDYAVEASPELRAPVDPTPPDLVSIAIIPSNPSISAGAAKVFTATGTFSDTSTEVLSSVTWTSSDNTVATITNDSTNRGHAFGLSDDSVTIEACAGSVCDSTTLTVGSASLTITGLFPPSAPIGGTVVVAGTGFGETQGGGDTVKFNGHTATTTHWSDTAIVATVPSDATGDVVVRVSSTDSNAVAFTATADPLITGLSPSSGPEGTSVTIAGANFGGSQGGSTVTFNGVPADVNSWSGSGTSIDVTVPMMATSGDVKVLIAGVASNGVHFGVPAIYTLLPQSGPVGALVAISGSGFGEPQDTSTVSIGDFPMQVISWTDTQILAAVGPGSETDTLSIHKGVSTIEGPTFAIDSDFPYEASPAGISMIVGESRTFPVKYSDGTQVAGLAWIASDDEIVSLSSDEPPVITALAVGSTTVYAGEYPISITVHSGTALPDGEPIWTVPLDTSELTLLPAVPSPSGADVFAVGNHGVTAISSRGEILWRADAGANWDSVTIPDFSGHVLVKDAYQFTVPGDPDEVHDTHRVSKVNSGTGSLTTLYTFTSETQAPGWIGADLYDDAMAVQEVIPGTTGTLFVQDQEKVVLFNLKTNAQIGTVTLEDDLGELGHMIVAGDGNAYVPYVKNDPELGLKVLRVSPNGSHATISVTSCPNFAWDVNSQWTAEQPDGISVVTNRDVGVALFASAHACSGENALMVLISNDVVTAQYDLSLQGDLPGFLPKLQRADGSYVGIDTSRNLIAISPAGETMWEQSGDNFTTPIDISDRWDRFVVTPLYATADGGVVVTSTQPTCPAGIPSWSSVVLVEPDNIGPGVICQGSLMHIDVPTSHGLGTLGTLYTLDKNGDIVSQTADTGARMSWTGNWYVDPQGTATRINAPPQGRATPQAQSSTQTGNRASPVCQDHRYDLSNEYGAVIVRDSFFQHRKLRGLSKAEQDAEIATWPQFTPSCFLFTSRAPKTTYFSFADFNSNSKYEFALIKAPLVLPENSDHGLQRWVKLIGFTPNLNSGYRSPLKNRDEVHGRPNSRHQFGDAADLDVASNLEVDWLTLTQKAEDANADYIEGKDEECSTNCAHADWRKHERNVYIIDSGTVIAVP